MKTLWLNRITVDQFCTIRAQFRNLVWGVVRDFSTPLADGGRFPTPGFADSHPEKCTTPIRIFIAFVHNFTACPSKCVTSCVTPKLLLITKNLSSSVSVVHTNRIFGRRNPQRQGKLRAINKRREDRRSTWSLRTLTRARIL